MQTEGLLIVFFILSFNRVFRRLKSWPMFFLCSLCARQGLCVTKLSDNSLSLKHTLISNSMEKLTLLVVILILSHIAFSQKEKLTRVVAGFPVNYEFKCCG